MKEKIKKLADYVSLLKEKQDIGFNQLAKASGINPKSLNEIVYGTAKRINPIFLIQLAGALGVHYKEFYKILGYLAEGDDIVKEKKTVINISGNNLNGNGQIVGENSGTNNYVNNYNHDSDDIIDLSKLSPEAATSIKTLYNTLIGK